jgi:GT2 family glycosyltransferase/glycosyltransferase involved in cell wall biosynthesis
MIRQFYKNIYHYLLISQSGSFDRVYYLKTYSDVRRANINPLWHFVKYGWKEGRNPSAQFSTKNYLALNPDVAKMNPLIHYIKYGIQENRRVDFSESEQKPFDYNDLSLTEASCSTLLLNANNPPRGADIIIFPIIDWFYRFQRPQQLARQFANSGHRVFYIETGFNSCQAPLVKKIAKNIYLVQLSCADPNLIFNTVIPDNALEELETSIKTLKDSYLISAAIIIVDLPFWRKLAISLKKSYGWKLLYDCMDLHTGFSTSSEHVVHDEQLLLQESDLVLTTSHFLYRHVKNKNKNVMLVPNGTDFDVFHQAVKHISVAEIKNMPVPVIGYYGAIADWFDTYLVGNLARKHTEWNFLLIGRTDFADLEPLQGLTNIYLLGEKPYNELPGFLSRFDVCIIPFKDLPLTNATNPVKLYEYLSAGKPVVSTRLDEISYYSDYVRLASSEEEWEEAIQESLAEDLAPELLKARYEFAKANTWQKRAEDIQATAFALFPKISVIVVTYNNFNFTKLCLESIIRCTSYPNYEIIIVDNASESETISYIRDFKHENSKVVLILNEENLGFAPANNQGARIAKGDYLIFLNNDTIVTPGWMYGLYYHLVSNPSVGMVGPVTNSIGNEAKIDVTYEKLDEINSFAARRAIKYSGETFEIKVLALFCSIISHDLFDQVGGLDELYKVGMFEDDDLAMKICEQGLKLLCAEDVFIHHFHGASFKKLDNKEYQDIFKRNKQIFEEKWNTTWISHRHKRD